MICGPFRSPAVRLIALPPPVLAISAGYLSACRNLGIASGYWTVFFFLYPSREDAERGTEFGGTGFLVGVPFMTGPPGLYHIHGVTNWHVAVGSGASVIRINRNDAQIEAFEFNPEEWIFDPGGHDIAISPPLPLSRDFHNAEVLSFDDLKSPPNVGSTQDIGAGDDIFMIGRFVDYVGSETNEPALRFGNISIFNAQMPVGPSRKIQRSIVLDMYSRTGFSGSPVFVYRTPVVTDNGLSRTYSGFYIGVLGVHWGQFPERWEIKSPETSRLKRTQPNARSIISDGRYVEGLSGMSCAAPSEYILSLFSHPKIIEMQRKIEQDMDLENPESWRGRLHPKYMHRAKDRMEYHPGPPRQRV